MVACLLVCVVATNIALRFYPPRYRAETAILVVPARVPDEYVHLPKTGDFEKRIATIQQQILSRTKLEHIVMEFNLYADERKKAIMEDVVQGMRNDITVQIVGGDTLRVRFDGNDPRTVMRVTERLSSLFINENLQERSRTAENTTHFIEGQLEDLHRRLDELETTLNARTRSGHALSKADTIEYEVAQQQYRDMLMKRQAAKTAANLENRQIGEQFKVLDPARIPEEPIAPNRLVAHAGGAAAGLGLGVILIGLTSRRRRTPLDQTPPEDAA